MKFTCFNKVALTMLSLMLLAFSVQAEKEIHKPYSFGGIDLNSSSSKWCYQRSKQTENFIIFWEAGYGTNPSTISDNAFNVNIDAVLEIAEKSFNVNTNDLKFVIKGNSKTDQYKMIILLNYTTEWQAFGSGVDDVIGLLTLSASSAQALGSTVAHEVGHCFQYQVACDGYSGGWRYGFGINGTGGNGWWEQCAQWQAFKVFPGEQFQNYNFDNHLNSTHLHPMHEEPRYANYFIQDYWVSEHGLDFIAKLWQQSAKPEDPIEAYKRIANLSQTELNDDMYWRAAKLTTWDVPTIREYGKNYIDVRPTVPMLAKGDYWAIDPSKCIENYGYNIIKLNNPKKGETVKVFFEGLAGTDGYRSKSVDQAGWRYGFVGLKENGERVYSPFKAAEYDTSNPSNTLEFICEDDFSRFWLVVVGTPKSYWRHAWDDDDTNDEQWPYQVKFENTNRFGLFEIDPNTTPTDVSLSYDVTMEPRNSYDATAVIPDWEKICQAFVLQIDEIEAKLGSSIKYCAVTPDGSFDYTSTAVDPGHWFDTSGNVTTWQNNSYVFSEFRIANQVFNIGQYPSICNNGDEYTIKQALVYTPQDGDAVTASFTFNITIDDNVSNKQLEKKNALVINTMVTDMLYLNSICPELYIYNTQGRLIEKYNNTERVDLTHLTNGLYIVKTRNSSTKILKK